jgi:hypothetical protein
VRADESERGFLAQEYTLKLNVKEGDTFKYRMSIEIDFGGQPCMA